MQMNVIHGNRQTRASTAKTDIKAMIMMLIILMMIILFRVGTLILPLTPRRGLMAVNSNTQHDRVNAHLPHSNSIKPIHSPDVG